MLLHGFPNYFDSDFFINSSPWAFVMFLNLFLKSFCSHHQYLSLVKVTQIFSSPAHFSCFQNMTFKHSSLLAIPHLHRWHYNDIINVIHFIFSAIQTVINSFSWGCELFQHLQEWVSDFSAVRIQNVVFVACLKQTIKGNFINNVASAGNRDKGPRPI